MPRFSGCASPRRMCVGVAGLGALVNGLCGGVTVRLFGIYPRSVHGDDDRQECNCLYTDLTEHLSVSSKVGW